MIKIGFQDAIEAQKAITPIVDVTTDIITIVFWHRLCLEGKLECHWWIISVIFVTLPILTSWLFLVLK